MNRPFSASCILSLALLLGVTACGGDDTPSDSGAADSALGDADAGDLDSSLPDSGDTDSGVPDSGGTDGGGIDGSVDGGADGGDMDGGGSDGGGLDGATDGGGADGATDGGSTDGSTDGGGADGATDGGSSDGGSPTDPAIFLARRDYRRCIFPLCGGFWLSAVNRPSTVCADGSMAAECYVAEIDWTALGLSPAQVSAVEANAGNLLVAGAGELRSIAGRTIGALVATAAWQAEWGTADIPAGGSTYYSVRDNGLRCLVPPCFNLALVVLNLGTTETVSGLDLTSAGASASDMSRGHTATSTGDLRVLGTISTDTTPGPGGAFGRTLDAQQFFLPVP